MQPRRISRAGWLELVATGVSALLIAAIVGILLRDAFRPNEPPALRRTLVRSRRPVRHIASL
jgi:hypothetical protein